MYQQKWFSCQVAKISCNKRSATKDRVPQGPARLGSQKTEPICIGHTSTISCQKWTSKMMTLTPCRRNHLKENLKDIRNHSTLGNPQQRFQGQLYLPKICWLRSIFILLFENKKFHLPLLFQVRGWSARFLKLFWHCTSSQVNEFPSISWASTSELTSGCVFFQWISSLGWHPNFQRSSAPATTSEQTSKPFPWGKETIFLSFLFGLPLKMSSLETEGIFFHPVLQSMLASTENPKRKVFCVFCRTLGNFWIEVSSWKKTGKRNVVLSRWHSSRVQKLRVM